MTALKAGDKAPDFKTPNQDGNFLCLSDFKGQKLVLFFYPKASTPGCTLEACNLSDNYKRFQAAGYMVIFPLLLLYYSQSFTSFVLTAFTCKYISRAMICGCSWLSTQIRDSEICLSSRWPFSS